MESTFTATNPEQAEETLKKGYEEAQKLLQDKDRLGDFLIRLEKKLKVIPMIGDTLSTVPLMAALLNSYARREYTEIPLGSIIAVVSALAYVVSPFDLIPDCIPGAGYLDDAAVVVACLKLVQSDLDEYSEWREKQKD